MILGSDSACPWSFNDSDGLVLIKLHTRMHGAINSVQIEIPDSWRNAKVTFDLQLWQTSYVAQNLEVTGPGTN